MIRASVVLTIVVLAFGAASSLPTGSEPEVLFSAPWLNFTFPTAEHYGHYIDNGWYKHVMLAGVKVSMTGSVFVSTPRWKPGVPATLSRIISTPKNGLLLDPYPSWFANKVGDIECLQSVLGFEIDSRNWLWALDQGKVAENPALPGSIKLIIYNLNTNTVVKKYTFTDEEASTLNSFLNDIVVDPEGGFAYITDSGLRVDGKAPMGALLVYDLEKNAVRRLLHNVPSTNPNSTLWININGDKVLSEEPMMTGADGIALSADKSTLYFCSLTSWDLFSIQTSYLRNFSVPENVLESQIQVSLNKGHASDGLACTNEVESGLIYTTSLEDSAIYRINLTTQATTVVAQNKGQMIWPDTIGFDHHGGLLLVTNHLYKFVEDALDFTNEDNFRIWRVQIGADSYMAPIITPSP